MGRVTGIGGIFFKSDNPENMRSWYRERLGIPAPTEDGSTLFRWRAHEDPERNEVTVWAPFERDTKYMDPSPSPFMINYIVEDMDGLLEQLRADGVELVGEVHELDYGKFAWILDPEGNKIELWEPGEVRF